jgi:hypothetical protein
MITNNETYTKIKPFINKLRVRKSGKGYILSLVGNNTQIKKMYDTKKNFVDYILFNNYEFIISNDEIYIGSINNTIKYSEINNIFTFYTAEELYTNHYELFKYIYILSKKFINEHEKDYAHSVILKKDIIEWLESISEIDAFKYDINKTMKSRNFNL